MTTAPKAVNGWMQLARGILLAGYLVVSACTSGAPREIPKASPEEAEVNNKASNNVTAVSGSAISPGIRENSASIAAMHSDGKNVSTGRSIYFVDSETGLSEESRNVLRQHADYLKQNPKRVIIVRAFLDGLGSRTFSLAIAQKRLDIAVQTLREFGVAKARIRQVMLGQRVKKVACESPPCKKQRQRIELLYK